MNKNILITGGTGTLGKVISSHLSKQGNNVKVLTRGNSETHDNIEMITWNPDINFLSENSLEGVDIIIHLAGAGIADKKWTKDRKKEIINTRVKTAQLIHEHVANMDRKPEAFITASAIGYYGYDTGSILVKETSRFGDDFLATVVKEWEAAADTFTDLGLRVLKYRFGIVLSRKGGALEMMIKPVKIGVGAGLGRGDQYISWVHENDVALLMEHAITHSVDGVFNAVSPNPVTNKDFMKTIARTLKKPFFLPNVPAFVMKLALGEKASMVLGGNRVSSEKLQNEGFKFTYEELDDALQNLLKT